MRTLISISLLVLTQHFLISQNIGVGTTTPDSSSILDITSDSSGILIPRMTDVQRNGISNPATGLLVFVTTDSTFNYFDGTAWVAFDLRTNMLVDADKDTKITVEKSPDEDTIRFIVAGKEFATMDGKTLGLGTSGGSVYIGQGAGESTADSIVGNTYIGNDAGFSTTTGHHNTYIGLGSGHRTTSGYNNVAIGDSTLAHTTFRNGLTAIGHKAGMLNEQYNNTFVGYQTGMRSINAHHSTFVGSFAGLQTQGISNTIIGSLAGIDTLTGHLNVFVGLASGAGTKGGTFNSFIGANSGRQNTTGHSNTYVGYASGRNNDGDFNVAVGDSALHFSTTVSGMVAVGHSAGKYAEGVRGTFIGNSAGLMNIGQDNTIIGHSAGSDTLTGGNNTFIGAESGQNNKSGYLNTFVGSLAGLSNSTGYANTFLGTNSGNFNITGRTNTYIGIQAGFLIKSGLANTFIGSHSGTGSVLDSTSNRNTFVGQGSGYKIRNGERNVFIGDLTGFNNLEGSYNTFVGEDAGYDNTIGNNNTYIGQLAGAENESGSGNVYLGHQSGLNGTIGSGNVFLGRYSGYFEQGNDKLYIDNDSVTTPLIYGDFIANYTTIHGELGINALNPDRELVIFDTDNDGDAEMKLNATNGSNREMLIGVNQANGGFVSMETDNDLIFQTNSNTRMTIENSGDIGIGTTNPEYSLHIQDNGVANVPTINLVLESVTSKRPTILFSENGSGLDLDDGMSIEYNGSTADNEMTINAVGGSPVMTVESLGNVGIGTSSPAFPLHIEDAGTGGTPTINVVLEAASSKRPTLLFSENASPVGLSDGMSIEYNGSVSGNEMTVNAVGGSPIVTFESFSGEVGIGTTNPTALLEVIATTVKKTAGGTWTASSDRRLKKEIRDYDEGLNEILKIRPVRYHYNELSGYDISNEHIGVIAQELEEITPHMVSKYGRDGTEFLQVDNSSMTYILVNAVKELNAKNEELKAQLKKHQEILDRQDKLVLSQSEILLIVIARVDAIEKEPK